MAKELLLYCEPFVFANIPFVSVAALQHTSFSICLKYNNISLSAGIRAV
jgi:arginine deiminase